MFGAVRRQLVDVDTSVGRRGPRQRAQHLRARMLARGRGVGGTQPHPLAAGDGVQSGGAGTNRLLTLRPFFQFHLNRRLTTG